MIKAFFVDRWLAYLAGVVLLVATDLLSLTIPWAIGKTVDAIGGSRAVSEYLWIIAAVSVSMAFLRFFYREFIMGTTRRLEHYMRSRIFSHAMNLPSAFYDEFGPGRVMALVVNDVSAVRFAVGMGVMLTVDAAVMGLDGFWGDVPQHRSNIGPVVRGSFTRSAIGCSIIGPRLCMQDFAGCRKNSAR